MHYPALVSMFAIGCFTAAASAKTIPNHAKANRVLGQPDFISSTLAAPTASTLNQPAAVVVHPATGKVFVADRPNHRVLRYPRASTLTQGAAAEAVFGQVDFESAVAGIGAAGMNQPTALFLDAQGRLWVADQMNHRVLVFANATTQVSHPDAERVYGQPDFVTVTSGTTASTMFNPIDVHVDSSARLWVADALNNRVLRFDAIHSKPSGSAADGVLGQSDFTSGFQGSGATGLQFPISLSMSPNGSLFVACLISNRVVRFNNAATLGNGAAANTVFGQPTFNSTTAGTTANRMSSPYGCFVTPDDSLWVSEYSNNRVVRFNNASTRGTGAAADGVVGQPDFTSNTAGTTDRSLSNPSFGPFVDSSGNLWTTENGNNRVLRFSPDVTKPKLTVTSTVPETTSKSSIEIRGKASDASGISKVTYKKGTAPTKTATGTTRWHFTVKLNSGKNHIRIKAFDKVRNVSVSKILTIRRR